MATKINGYQLSRNFWDFAFENTGKIKPIHIAIYFFAMEHCNRLGWKREFGLPTSMVLDAITVKSYSVYKTAFDDLVEYGFFEVVQYSKNQYSSNIIALKENDKANYKALDKALVKHTSKQRQSTVSIDKPIKQLTKEQLKQNMFSDELFMGDLQRTNRGKDFDLAFNQCWTHFSQQPEPLLEWQWRQKFSSWLTKMEAKGEQKNKYKVQ